MQQFDQSQLIPILGIDIGGTMTKVSLAVKKGQTFNFKFIENLTIDSYKDFDVQFFVQPSNEIDGLIEKIIETGLSQLLKRVYITGGGAFKYSDQIQTQLNLEVVKVNEFDSLSRGFNFLDHLTPNDSFYTYSKLQGSVFIERNKSIYPFLLVNIGSGVSIIKFDDVDKYERVGGTSLGGGMFLGLCNALTGIKDYDLLLQMSKKGVNCNDLLISDVNLGNVSPGNLSPSAHQSEKNVAVSLGKLIKNESDSQEVKQEDLIKSLLYMTAYNISQIAFLSSVKQNIHRIFFSGYFIRGHKDTIECITNAFDYFSKQEVARHPYFVKHDGFVGSIGALQQAFEEQKYQFD